MDADDWAKTEAMPSDEEIHRVRQLISRIRADMDDLTASDKLQIEQAVVTVRRARNSMVGLGLPRIGLPHNDFQTERNA
ncbi:hypothetical protein ACFROC_05665 [Nocardia tengchongensis]|uniref:hypothetical protein n=1 Tax=Nocardia tengchongensis TaxID=2055889 RepID=UPI0036AD1CEC